MLFSLITIINLKQEKYTDILSLTFTTLGNRNAKGWVFFLRLHLTPFLTHLTVSLCVIGKHISWKNGVSA